jgi:hypothetical protein
MHEAIKRDPALLRDAAAGRSGPMMDAMAHEARVRADPTLRADRFVERWQASASRRGAPSAGDQATAAAAGSDEHGEAAWRDPQVDPCCAAGAASWA